MNRLKMRYWRFDLTYKCLRYGWLWQSVGWALVALVVILSLMPKPPEVDIVLNWDKARHMFAYLVLMLWFAQSFRTAVWWAVFLIALGIGLELAQGWGGYRQLEYADVLANTLGVGCGLLLAHTPLGLLVPTLDRHLERLSIGI